MRSTTTRRSVVATLRTGIVGSLAGCLGGQSDLFQQQIQTVREATQPYTDHRKALEDGFKPGGPFVPGMGWHFTHPKRVQNAAKNGFSLEKPQVLTYDKDLNLGAVEWAAPKQAVENSHELFADERTSHTESWEVHAAATHVFAVPDDQQTNPKNIPPKQFLKNSHWAEFRPPDKELKPGDSVELQWGSLKAKEETPKEERVVDLVQTHPDLQTLHAWVHTENPKGMFNPTNPDFAGGKGSDDHHD